MTDSGNGKHICCMPTWDKYLNNNCNYSVLTSWQTKAGDHDDRSARKKQKRNRQTDRWQPKTDFIKRYNISHIQNIWNHILSCTICNWYNGSTSKVLFCKGTVNTCLRPPCWTTIAQVKWVSWHKRNHFTDSTNLSSVCWNCHNLAEGGHSLLAEVQIPTGTTGYLFMYLNSKNHWGLSSHLKWCGANPQLKQYIITT